MLRASSQHSGGKIDLTIVNGGGRVGDCGIPHERRLIEFAEAVLGTDDSALDQRRAGVLEALGSPGLVDAAAVVGLFNAIDRVADSTGIPLEEEKAAGTVELRERLHIGKYAEPRS